GPGDEPGQREVRDRRDQGPWPVRRRPVPGPDARRVQGDRQPQRRRDHREVRGPLLAGARSAPPGPGLLTEDLVLSSVRADLAPGRLAHAGYPACWGRTHEAAPA